MRSICAGADALLLGGFKWLSWDCHLQCIEAGGWKRNIGIQALWGLMTVIKQPGEIVAGTLKPSHFPPDSSQATSPAFIPE